MSEQTQTDDFAAIAKPHPAPQSQASAAPTPGDDFASIAKPHPGAADEQADPLAMPTLHDLSQKTPEQAHEGLYRMKDEHGNLYGVPYSNVTQVENFRDSFVDESEAQRYEKDAKSDTPTWKDKLLAHTKPMSDADKAKLRAESDKELQAQLAGLHDPKDKETARKMHEGSVDAEIATKDFSLGLANGVGTLALHPWEAIKGTAEFANHAISYLTAPISGNKLEIAGSDEFKKMVGDMVSQLTGGKVKISKYDDTWKDVIPAVKDISGNATSYGIGQVVGQIIAAKGAETVVPKVLKTAKGTPEAVANNIRNRAGTGVHSTEKLVRDTAVKNETVGPEAERIRKENDEVIAKAKTEAEKQHAEKVEAVRKKNAENAAKVEKKNEASSEGVRQANEKAAVEHTTAVDERNELVDKRIAAERRAAEMRTRLHNHLQDIHQSAERYFANQYDTLSELTKGTRVDFSPLVEAVEDGKLEDIAGSDTKVPVFEDVLKRAKGEKGIGGAKPEGWDDLAPDEKKLWAREHANDNGITYKDLVGYYRELGKLLKSTSTASDVKDAIVNVRKVIERLQDEAAKKADVEAAAKAAEQKKAKPPSAAQLNYAISEQYKNFAESYRDPGAEGTKAVKAGNAFEATKPYLSDKLSQEQLSEIKQRARGKDPLESGRKTNATKWAGRNSAADTAGKRLTTKQRRAQTERLIDQARKAQEDLAVLPDVGAPPTPPESIPEPEPLPMPEPIPEPEFKPKTPALKDVPEEKKLSQRDLQLYKRAQLNKTIDSLETSGMKIGPRGLGTFGLAEVVTYLLGGSREMMAGVAAGTAAVSYLGPKVLARILKMPGVAEKLLTITKADVEALEKLPANQRVEAEQMIISLAQTAKLNGTIKPSDPTPLAKWAKADMAKAKAAESVKTWKDVARSLDESTADLEDIKNLLDERAKAGHEQTEAVVEPAEPERGAVEVKLPVREESSSGQTAEPVPQESVSEPPPPAPAAPEPPPAPQPAAATPSAPLAPVAPVEPPPAVEPRNDHQPSRRLEDLKVDPKRFQYKLGGNKQGVTDSMSDAKWEQHLADPIHIWEDPETGDEYVINGHHRYDLAQKAGAERINTQKISNKEWPDAAAARRFGALKNIADGNGTAVDAAKFMREKGYTLDELRQTGLSLKKGVAKDGLALSRLTDDLFDRVVAGDIEPRIGAAIGDASEVASDQEAILKDIRRREKAGRTVTPEQIRESARLIKSSPTRTETTTDLFGDHEEERNLFLEMGEVSEYVQHELADERRIFKRVASKGASDQLAKGKNVINPEENAKIATQAAQQRELYLKRSAQAGPIHAALQEAAERLAEGENPNAVKQQAFDEIREHLAEELGHSTE